MDNALVDIIKKGDKEALNAYLSGQTISGDSSGISINGQPNNALTSLIRGQNAAMTQQNAQPIQQQSQPLNSITRSDGSQVSMQQPMNTIQNVNSGQYVTPQGGRVANPAQAQFGSQSPNDNFDYQNPISMDTGVGYRSKVDPNIMKVIQDGETHIINGNPPPPTMQDLQIAKMKQELGKGNEPKFDSTSNSFIYPPDAQHPNGMVVPAGGAAGVGPISGLTGDALLSALPKPQADQIKALAEGRMQFPAGFALKSPYWQDMISKVSQYDPSFDAVNYNARAKTRSDFTSGKTAQQINAMNTVTGHLQSLSDAADSLNNSNWPLYNTVANAMASNSGDPRIKQFDATKKAVVDELTRVWRGSGGSEGDIKTWSDTINNAGSPAQLHGVIGQIGELLNSKLNALGEQYQQGMGTTANPIQLVTPKSKQVLNLLEQGQVKRHFL